MTSGTSISFTRDPATDKPSSFILRCVVLYIQTFFDQTSWGGGGGGGGGAGVEAG